MPELTEQATTETPWEWWLKDAARSRKNAKQQYAEARLCDTWAEETNDPVWAATYRIWARRHRASARWHQQSARGAIAHVKKLWPEAAQLDT